VRSLHTLLIISDPTSRGMQTAGLIKKMVDDDKVIRCDRLGLVFNRVLGNEELLSAAAARLELEVVGMIPFDENISAYDLVGKPITELPADSPSLAVIRGVVNDLVLR
jgi:CO dehydrogenase maturation factor